MQILLDKNIFEVQDIPYTISYVIRKRQQIDGMSELPRDKRPPEKMIWDGDPEEIDEWLDNIYSTTRQNKIELEIREDEIG